MTKTPEGIIKHILGDKYSKSRVPATHNPKPKDCRCNRGHLLREVYNPKRHAYQWDCPTCIKVMHPDWEEEYEED